MTIRQLSDAQVVTAHRTYAISNGELVDILKERGYSDDQIMGIARANFAVRQEELETVDWIH